MNCLQQFPVETKKFRFKKCEDCQRLDEAMPASIIITNKSKRLLQRERREARANAQEGENQQNGDRLVSKLSLFDKTIQQPANGGPQVDAMPMEVDDRNVVMPQKRKKLIWHRDIAAAKAIFYKGEN